MTGGGSGSRVEEMMGIPLRKMTFDLRLVVYGNGQTIIEYFERK